MKRKSTSATVVEAVKDQNKRQKKPQQQPQQQEQPQRQQEQQLQRSHGGQLYLKPRVFEKDDAKGIQDHMTYHGYVVVRVMNREEVAASRTQFVSTLSSAFGVDVNNFAKTISRVHGVESTTFGGLKMKPSGMCHSAWTYDVKAACRGVFATLFGEQDVVTSFDQVNLLVNRKQLGLRKPSSGSLCLHVDRDVSDNWHRHSTTTTYQGIALITASNEKTGGFVCVPGSHKAIKKWLSGAKRGHQQFTPINTKNETVAAMLKETPAVRLITPSGVVIVFSNDLVHGNRPRTDFSSARNILRIGAYVNFVPRNMLNEGDEKRRRHIIESMSVGTHWPHSFSDRPNNVRRRDWPMNCSSNNQYRKGKINHCSAVVGLSAEKIMEMYGDMI